MMKSAYFTVLLTITAASLASAQCIEGNCYEGNGTFRFENGDKLTALWKKGLANGYGMYFWANGDIYKGNFLSGKMDGRGTYTYANGDKYIGTWKEGKMEGRGHFHWNLPGDLMTNAKYEGNFKAGKPVNVDVPDTAEPLEPPAMK